MKNFYLLNSPSLQRGVRGCLLFLALVATTALWAEDFSVGGIYYNILKDKTNEVEVTYRGSSYNSYSNEYTGSVTIPSTVTYNGTTYNITSIRSSAFFDCSGLTSVTIGNSVTSIGNGAFMYCSSLTSVTIPNSVTSIESYAFYGCSGLTSVVIPNSVTSIGDRAFYGCSLTSPVYNAHCFAYMPTSYSGAYTIPEGIKQIAGGAFYLCSSLTSVTIPNSVTSIESYAFYECYSLISVTIPNSVTSIGNYAFRFCSGLTSVTIGNSVTSIGYKAFFDCSGLTSVTIGNSVTSIGDYAFRNCSSLSSITTHAENPSIIGNDAFYGVRKTIPVYVPCGSVVSYKAAEGWKNFTNIQEPLSEYSLIIDTQNAAMGSASVDKNTACGAQISATANEGYFFKQWSDGNTENPRALVLNRDTNLIAEFEKDNTTIDSTYCIYYTSSDGNIITPKSLDAFGANLVSNIYQDSIGVITFDGVVTSIGYYAFEGSSLASIIIPNGVTNIGEGAFTNCSSLISIKVEKDNAIYDSREDCNAIIQTATNTLIAGCQNTIIPNGVMQIANSAFFGCSSLTSIVIPNSVTRILESAFEGCSSLFSIEIGESVTTIENRAFFGCYSINTIYCYPVAPPEILFLSTFENCKATVTVYVPCQTVDAYKAAYGWRIFADNIQEPLPAYSIFVSAQNNEMGEAMVDRNTYCEGAQISATANEGYLFKQWNDGDTDNPRILTLTQDTILTAEFIKVDSTYQIYYTSSDGNIVTPYKTDNFGANIISNTYDNGQGVITFDAPLKLIGNSAFENCTSLTSIIIPDSVISIDGYAFNGCSSLTSVYIPEGVQYIGGKMTFAGCSSITKIDIPESVGAIGPGAFMGCISLTSITLPNEITTLEEHIFANCTSLLSVTLGNNIKKIFHGAFKNCTSLVYITVPANVQNIFEEAFYNCTAITSITSLAITPPEVLSISAFTNVVKTIPVYVPCGSVDAYKSAYGWKEFTNIQELLSEYSLVVNTQNSVMGSAKVEKNSACEAAQISATANEGYLFKQWSDGNTDNPRTLVLTQDTVLTAIFAAQFVYANIYEETCDSYSWNGQVYTESGEYTYRTTASNGCDSVVTLHLTINTSKTFEETIVACDSYTWNGQVYSESGEYTYRTTASNGCDSVVTLHLTINTSKTFEETIVACDSYTWNGQVYSESGEYTYRTTASNGCDSVVTLHLTINTSKTFEETIVTCDSYTWNGQVYTESGEYTYRTTASNGCDSVVTLHLTINTSKTFEETIVACDSYSWNGQVYSESGEYTYRTTASNGCDSVVTLHLTINTSKTFEETIVACDSYTWNGQVYTESGEYTYRTTASNGCDSVVTLHLTINTSKTFEETIVACDSYSWNGQVYTESGEYTYRTTASNGCDSVVTLHLTINTSKTFEETIVACDSYTWNGQVYTESGEYTYRTTASNGCDSVVTLHLTINTSKTFEETIVACDSYTWNGQVYTESGEYTYRTTASNGCDSVVTLHLTINKSAVAEMEYATICNGETYTWNGAVYYQAGDYSVTLNTAAGCDSIVSLKLIILPAMQTETQNLELCTSDLPYSWYGQTLTEAGTYTYIEQYAGYTCDSVEHVLNLQVHTLVLPSSVSLPVAVCGSSIDVSAATADIEAFIASEPTYAANATVTWQQQQAGIWTALSTQPLDGDQGEVIVRYMIISDCGVLEAPEMVVPVEMPTPENSSDLDEVRSVSKYNNRIFLFHLNDFVKKYGWTPQPEQVIWYKVVGDMDAYGAPSNDMVVGIGHSYHLPDGSVIKGDYYALIIQDSPNSNGCTSVYRTVVLTATQDENNSPALVPNVVQPNAQLSLQNLDPTKVHEVRVYDTSGDCIATYMAEHVSEFLFNANHVAGYYLVYVINENNKITLRYVVK